MEFLILGPTEVLDEGQPLLVPRGRGRALLALLVLRAGEVVSTDRLIDELWGETPPPTVGTALQGLVSKLRKHLEPNRVRDELPSVVVTRHPGYLLAVDPGRVDANRFRRLVAEAGGSSVEETAKVLRKALSLWRGPALADFIYEPFAQSEIAALEELRLTAIEKRIEADLALGRHAELVGELEGLVAEHPLRERLREHLILSLYRSGRQVEALEVFTNVRHFLVELGLDPGSTLQRLEGLILRQDPSLDLEIVSPPSSAIVEPSPESTVPVPPWIAEERKTVTVVFIDVATSTSVGQAPDDEAVRRVLARFFSNAAEVVTGHGGSVEELIGDTLVGLFGIPTAREDDALRAVRAAVDLRHLLAASNEELKQEGEFGLVARTGINTGEVVVGVRATGKAMASGSAIKGAARLQERATQGEVLLGEATRLLIRRSALLEPAERSAMEGYELPLPAWRLVDLIPGAPALPRHLEAPMIGRERELTQLRAAYDRTVRERNAKRLTVLGDAGIGKSRLARELTASLGSDAWVLTGRCPSYGNGITFWPLREIVLGAAGGIHREALLGLLAAEQDAESIADQMAGAIGSTDAVGSPGALFPMLRRFFEALARNQPVALILEDLHWAQPTFLDLVEYLTETTRGPVFLLCLARPELLEERVAWAEGAKAGSLVLEPLGPEESRKLVANRLTGPMLPAETLTRIVQTAQGNPLFVEQMVAALGEEGGPSIPATVQALLAARLDRLGPAERDLIRTASVLGNHFSLAVLMPLLANEARRSAPRNLQVLERKDLIFAPPGSPPGRELSFRHVLIQQAVYRSMTKATRADLHERVAEWFATEAGQDTKEFEETIGYHLEQAYEYRRELKVLDAHDRVLAVRAGERLANAGIRAFARFDAAAAENLLSRAMALLPDDHSQQWEVGRQLAEAYQVMGRHNQAEEALSYLLEKTRTQSDSRLKHYLLLERARVRLATGPDPMRLDAIQEEATDALAVYETVGDESGSAQAYFVLGEICLRRARLIEMEGVARRGLAHADRSGSAREELGARRLVATALEAGPTPVVESIHECEELALWRGTENAGVQPVLAHLRSMLGEFDAGRELIARTRQVLVERTRARRPLVLLTKRSGEVEILAGDLANAEGDLREALELALDMELQEEISHVAAILSRVLSMRGNSDEAAELAALCKDHAPAESVAAQALWRAAMARTLAKREDSHAAGRLAREAVHLIPPEMLNLGADLRVNLAEILLATGQRTAALSAISDAIDLYERKGNLAAVIQARSLAEFAPR